MASRFTVDAVFRAIDKVSRPVSRMQRRVNKFTRSARNGFRRLNFQVKKFGATLRSATVAATAILLPFGAAVGDIVRTGATFEQTITNAAAKFGILDKNADGATEKLASLNDIARKLGASTEFTASAAAEGLNFLAFAGFKADEAIAALPGLVDLATAAQIELGEASDIATDSLGAFGLAVKNDAAQQAKNLTRISDAMAKTTITANTNMMQLMDTVADAAPIWTTAGQSLEEFLAVAAQLANAGIKGSKAGTQMKNMVTKLVNATGPGAAVMKNLGVSIVDATEGNVGGVRKMTDILEDLDKALNSRGFTEGSAKRAQVFATIFGVRAFSGVAVAIKAGIPAVRDYRTELEKANGVTKEMAAFMRDTLTGRMKETVSAFEGLKLTIFELKNSALGTLMETLTGYIRNLDGVIFANKNVSASFIDGLVSAVTGTLQIFGLLVGAFVALKLVTLAGSATMLAWSGVMLVVKGVMLAFKTALVVARVAMLAFNLAMSLNPIAAILLALGLFIAALVWVGKNWDDIVASFSRGIEFIANKFKLISAPFKLLFAGAGKVVGAYKQLFGDDSQRNPFLEGQGPLAPGVESANRAVVAATRKAALDAEDVNNNAGALSAEGIAALSNAPQVVTPAERTASAIEDRRETTTAEVTIRPAAGVDAEVTAGKAGPGLTLVPSGAF